MIRQCCRELQYRDRETTDNVAIILLRLAGTALDEPPLGWRIVLISTLTTFLRSEPA